MIERVWWHPPKTILNKVKKLKWEQKEKILVIVVLVCKENWNRQSEK